MHLSFNTKKFVKGISRNTKPTLNKNIDYELPMIAQ